MCVGIRVEGTRVLITLSLFISSWLIQCYLHIWRETTSTPVVPKQTHDNTTTTINTLELFMERVHAGAPGLVQVATAAGQQGFLLQRALPRLLSMGWEHNLGGRSSLTACITPWKKMAPSSTSHNVLQFSLLPGLCLLFKAPTFNSVREKLQ